jgi:hypothetical protein
MASGFAQQAPAEKPAAEKQAEKPPEKLDITVEQVLEKSIEATGGRAAHEKLTSTVSKGTVEVLAQGLKGAFELYAKAPNKFVLTMNLQGLGEFLQGFDGQIGWAQNPFQGTRELEGVELAIIKREAVFNGDLKWKELFEKAELVGKQKVGEQDAYVVRLTPSVGKPVTRYYDAQTFLLLRTDETAEGEMGTMTQEVYTSDYREIDGVKVPFLLKQHSSFADLVFTITEVKNNVDISDSKFAKPAAAGK